MDCYHVPFLFPKVNFAIFEHTSCDLFRLIYEYKEVVNWEGLYLAISSDNIHIINPLIERLPKLKLLYIYSYLESDDVLNIDRKDIKAFIVDNHRPLTYSFTITSQIN